MIREWSRHVLHKIVNYKAQHRNLLDEAVSALQLVLPDDIMTNNVLPFLELPSHIFDGEDGENEEEGINSSGDGNEYIFDEYGGDGEEEKDEDNNHDEVYNAPADGVDDEEQQQQQDDEGGRKRRKTADDGAERVCV